jgi:hypothetical protein
MEELLAELEAFLKKIPGKFSTTALEQSFNAFLELCTQEAVLDRAPLLTFVGYC